jgi:hypothetical protein
VPTDKLLKFGVYTSPQPEPTCKDNIDNLLILQRLASLRYDEG